MPVILLQQNKPKFKDLAYLALSALFGITNYKYLLYTIVKYCLFQFQWDY